MSYQKKDSARFSRAQWMERYETECIKLHRNIRGRIDWCTADYFYLHGYTPANAAKEWLGQKNSEPA